MFLGNGDHDRYESEQLANSERNRAQRSRVGGLLGLVSAWTGAREGWVGGIKVFSLFILLLPISVLGQSVSNWPIVTEDDLLKVLITAPKNPGHLLASHKDLISAHLCDRFSSEKLFLGVRN